MGSRDQRLAEALLLNDVIRRKRKLVEQAFGWMKTVGLFRKLRHRGGRLVDWLFSFGAAAYNLVRWRNLVTQQA